MSWGVLQMNDLMRDKLMRKDGTLPLWAECVAGGMVSFCITDFDTYYDNC